MYNGLNSAKGSFLQFSGLQRNALLFMVAPLMAPGTLDTANYTTFGNVRDIL
jgi:hypothetical protein